MLNMPNSVKIKITSFANPNEFYFKFSDEKWAKVNNATQRKVSDIQRKIGALRTRDDHQPIVVFGEVKLRKIKCNAIVLKFHFSKIQIYGCFHSKWKKWVRGRVIERCRNGEYQVFLIDHGFVKPFQRIINIPPELKVAFDHIQSGSLPLKSNLFCPKTWSNDALAICKELDSINDRAVFNFIPAYIENGIHVGDLFVVDNAAGKTYSVTEKLISSGCASKCTGPSEIFKSLLEKEVDVLENCRHPKQKIELYRNTVPPKHLIIHGQHLKPPWKTAADFQFPNFYKQHISNNLQTLSHLQSFIWPQINAGQNVITIARNQDDHTATSSYLVPLIAAIITSPNQKAKPERMGPIAIIFASCAFEAEEIAQLCRGYDSSLNVLKATGACESKKYDLISGCDLLITTPPALARMMNNISINILDEKRLRHVVFNNFHRLASKFTQHVDKSLKLFLKFSQRPQFIATSDSHTNALKCKLINHLPPTETVLCVDDNHIEAASYVGMTCAIEFAIKRDDVHEILSRNSINHERKTIIVASDDSICNHLENLLSTKGVKFINCCNDEAGEDAAKHWNELTNTDEILIISDSALERKEISTARNLIHFDLPNNWKQFSRRFQVFRNAISDKLNAKDAPITTQIFLHDENVEQFFTSDRLMDFATSQNLPKSFKDISEVGNNQFLITSSWLNAFNFPLRREFKRVVRTQNASRTFLFVADCCSVAHAREFCVQPVTF
jgi:hypothetical protein